MSNRLVSALAALVLVSVGGQSMAVERPKYSVELSDPPNEIRMYLPTTVAKVHVDGERNAAVNAGFRILANYIFGNNKAKAKVAMTAPVTQSAGESIAMTSPVEQNRSRNGWEVSFTMPAAYTLSTLPTPQDVRVSLLAVPAHRVAAIKFSGFWSDSNLQSHEAQLLAWVKSRHLTAIATPTYAYYDPPWTPWFLRTIEILVDLAPSAP